MNVYGIIAIEDYDNQGERFDVRGIDASNLLGVALTKSVDTKSTDEVVGVITEVKKIFHQTDVKDWYDSILWEKAHHTPVAVVKATITDEKLKTTLASGACVYFAACGKTLEREIESKEFDINYRAVLKKTSLDAVAVTLRPTHRLYRINPIDIIQKKDPPANVKPPMQPIVWTTDGCIRFLANRIVEDLLNVATAHGFGLNEIVRRMQAGEYGLDELVQLDQLIGYSVSGFGDLSYVPRELVAECDAIAHAMSKEKK